MGGSLVTLADADSVWIQAGQSGNWRKADESAFSPYPKGTPLQQIAAAANEVRDAHLVMSLVTELRKGKRVFAVAGMSHVIRYEQVLSQSLP
jgi:hypothetical protein